MIYAHVEEWYRSRYGARVGGRGRQLMRGVTLVAATPFEFSVPVTASRVEVEGETAWLSFPSSVQPDDNVLSWVDNPPNWETYSVEVRQSTLDAVGMLTAGLAWPLTSTFRVLDKLEPGLTTVPNLVPFIKL